MMLRDGSALLSALAATLMIPGFMATPAAAQSAAAVVNTSMVGNAGKEIGKLQLREGPQGTVMRLTIAPGNVSPGWHAIHFHAVGDCSDIAKFAMSMAHVNHAGKQHGLLNPGGPDDGDLPNVFAASDGAVNAEVYTIAKLSGADGLRDSDGSALILHANADDYVSQPIGGAGDRIGCAVIK